MGFWSLFNKHFWKLFFGMLGMIAAGLFVAYGTNYYSYYRQFGEQVKREDLQRAEADKLRQISESDTYGGETPEETLAFFIAALRKGGTDSAAKYFATDKQSGWGENLRKIKEAGQLEFMVMDLGAAKRGGDSGPDNVGFSVFNSKNEPIAVINIMEAPNGIWKITDF